MPVRIATPEETKAWLGNGIVLPGPKRGASSISPSLKGLEPLLQSLPEALGQAQELAQQVQEILPPDLVEKLPSELGDLLNPPEEGSTPSD